MVRISICIGHSSDTDNTAKVCRNCSYLMAQQIVVEPFDQGAELISLTNTDMRVVPLLFQISTVRGNRMLLILFLPHSLIIEAVLKVQISNNLHLESRRESRTGL